jgi:hypothetical protein
VEPVVPKKTVFRTTAKTLDISKLSELPANHFCVEYVIGRKIPEEQWHRLYYTDDVREVLKRYDVAEKYKDAKIPENDSRLILPFFSVSGELMGFQGRSFVTTKKNRYCTYKFSEQDMVFGAETVDFSKPVLVVEGPIDSLFLPNCLAVASSDLGSVRSRLPTVSFDPVFVFDNENRNKEILKIIRDVIDLDEKVCIWPEHISEKDINDMIISGMASEEVLSIIRLNTHSGLQAQLNFESWKKRTI